MKLVAKTLQKALKGAGIDSEIHQDKTVISFEELLVPLGTNPSGQELVMQIGILQNSAEREKEISEQGGTSLQKIQLQFIQFLIMVPLRIEQPLIADTQAFINLINAVIELPGFGIIDSERMPFFRYTMTCNRNEVDEELFVMTVGLILHVIDTYLEMLEEIAQGHKQFSDFLKDVQHVSES